MVGLTRLLVFAQYKYADTSLMEFQMALICYLEAGNGILDLASQMIHPMSARKGA